MTTREAIQAITEYLNMDKELYSDVIFESEEVLLNGITLMFFDYDNGGMTLYDLDYDEVSSLNMTELIKLFPTLRYKAICNVCDGTKKTLASYDPYETQYIDCDCDDVIYPI